jgi:hypothetical protein
MLESLLLLGALLESFKGVGEGLQFAEERLKGLQMEGKVTERGQGFGQGGTLKEVEVRIKSIKGYFLGKHCSNISPHLISLCP